MHYELLIVSVAGSLMLAGCAVRPATPLSITLASPSVRQEGQVAIYLEVCDVPAPMRVTGQIEVLNDGRERSAIERDLVDKAARLGASAIILHPNNRWVLGAAYTSAEPDSFDPIRFSRATAVVVLYDKPTTLALADARTGSSNCGSR